MKPFKTFWKLLFRPPETPTFLTRNPHVRRCIGVTLVAPRSRRGGPRMPYSKRRKGLKKRMRLARSSYQIACGVSGHRWGRGCLTPNRLDKYFLVMKWCSLGSCQVVSFVSFSDV